MVTNNYVLNPYYELLPDYKICPFSTYDLRKNKQVKSSQLINSYFHERFHDRNWSLTSNGREAINIALNHYSLNKDDIVTIFTTSGNRYISSCVTNEIEKFCNWSRTIEKKTRIIFVNHEFGYPYQNLNELINYNLPIIEDCAHSFFSNNSENTVGKIGDFVIYSFPKIFPIQYGGVLTCKTGIHIENNLSKLDENSKYYLTNVLSANIIKKDKIISKRISNYKYLNKHFSSMGLNPRFELKKNIVPGVFMFKTPVLKTELAELKKIVYAHGIQCSIFYGEEAFYIPCHQNLVKADLDYFVEVIKPHIY